MRLTEYTGETNIGYIDIDCPNPACKKGKLTSCNCPNCNESHEDNICNVCNGTGVITVFVGDMLVTLDIEHD